MEEALRASQATLEAALASMTDAVFIADTDGRLVRFNDAFAVFHKFPDKNDCPRTLAEYLAVLELSSADGEPMPPENWPVMRALRGEAVSNAEYTLRRRDTTQTWMGSYSFGPIRDKRGTIIGAVVSVRDISEQKRLEADRQRQYSTLQGINHLLAATLNCQTEQELGAICLEIVQQLTASDFGFIGEVNDRGLHDIAISDPGWAACSIADNGNRHQPPGNFKLHGLYGRVLLDGQSLFTNDPANHPDRIGFPPGHPPVETFLGVPLRQNGKVIGMVGVANRANGYTQAEQETLEALAPVIVEAFMRKRAEVALRAGEERLRLAQEAAQAGSWEWDVLTGGMAWSEELWHLYGLEPGSAEPSPALWRQVVHPEDIQRVERTIRHAVVGGGEINTEWRVVTSSGDCRWLMSRGKPILDDAGRATRYLGIVIDITSRKQAEILRENEVGLRMAQQQLQVANEDLGRRVAQRTLELEETQKKFLHAEKLSAIGKLSASIAHEFNNPLQGILSVLKGLKKRAILEAEDRELLEAAIAESDRIKELIRGLQDFNRPSSGRKTLMDVHRSLNSLLLLHKSDFKEKRIVLQRNFADNLPQIMAVPDQIKQVLLNLLTNAADACHHPGGMITITTWHDDQQVAIAIQDTGSGIGPEELELIFQPFYTSKPEVKGTGLGLSVSYGIVKHHGGEILVDSAPGVGSTFTVRLPINGPLEQSAIGD